jgi:Raf kinase inhibitor-like YbhB/YbcL family protein
VILLLLAACSKDKGHDSNPSADDSSTPTDDSGTTEDLTLYSPDFEPSAGDPLAAKCDFLLPKAFSCKNGNPEMRWEHAPTDTVTFVLIMDDPDANDFPHWAIYNIPATATGLDADISGETIKPHTLPAGAIELENGHGSIGYFGSCPPKPHIYEWQLWALRDSIDDKPEGATAKDQFAWLEAEANHLDYDSAGTCHIYDP